MSNNDKNAINTAAALLNPWSSVVVVIGVVLVDVVEVVSEVVGDVVGDDVGDKVVVGDVGDEGVKEM